MLGLSELETHLASSEAGEEVETDQSNVRQGETHLALVSE